MEGFAPKPTPMITLANDEVGWQAAIRQSGLLGQSEVVDAISAAALPGLGGHPH